MKVLSKLEQAQRILKTHYIKQGRLVKPITEIAEEISVSASIVRRALRVLGYKADVTGRLYPIKKEEE